MNNAIAENISKRVVASGNKSKIYDCFQNIGFENKDDINTFLEYIYKNKNVLSSDEVYEIKTKFPSFGARMMGFMIAENEYYINLKYSTIIILALILDIEFTKGFASVLLGFLGITDTTFVKISEYNGEKCIIKETINQKEKIGNEKILEKYHGECCNNQYNCKYQDTDKCKCCKTDIMNIYNSLCDKGIFKKYASSFKYQL